MEVILRFDIAEIVETMMLAKRLGKVEEYNIVSSQVVNGKLEITLDELPVTSAKMKHRNYVRQKRAGKEE